MTDSSSDEDDMFHSEWGGAGEIDHTLDVEESIKQTIELEESMGTFGLQKKVGASKKKMESKYSELGSSSSTTTTTRSPNRRVRKKK